MMRFALTGALAALLLSEPGPAVAADSDKDAREIVLKAIDAQGGAANIEKYKAASVKTKGKFHGFGLNADTIGTIQAMSPDKVRIESKSKNDGQEFTFLMVINGDKGWMIFGGSSQELDKEMMTETHEHMYASRVADLRGVTGKDFKLKLLPDSKVGNKPVTGVRVSCAGHRDVDLFFDKESSLLLKSETRAKEPSTSGEYASQTLYDNYKKVNGLMVAHSVQEKHDGTPYTETEITEVTLAETLPDSVFAKP
jgi:hypothetical protein